MDWQTLGSVIGAAVLFCYTGSPCAADEPAKPGTIKVEVRDHKPTVLERLAAWRQVRKGPAATPQVVEIHTSPAPSSPAPPSPARVTALPASSPASETASEPKSARVKITVEKQ